MTERWERCRTMAELVAGLPEIERAPVRVKQAAPAGIEFDSPQVIARATQRLRTAAAAIEGQHGNDQGYKIMAAIFDDGCLRDTAVDLFSEIYNPRCEPPFSEDEVNALADHAIAHKQNANGCYAPPDPVKAFAGYVQAATQTDAPPKPEYKFRLLSEAEQDA